MRILKTADDTVRAQSAEWEKKTAASLDGLGKKHSEQCKLAEASIMARLPTDKRRAKAEKVENMLRDAVESWYKGLSRTRILEMLKGELVKRIAQVEEFAVNEQAQVRRSSAGSGQRRAVVRGIERKEAEAMLKSVTGTFEIEELPSVHGYPEIILETGSVRVTVSIQKTIDYLFQEKRAELTEALLSKDFTEEV
jgi:hypothetical protein